MIPCVLLQAFSKQPFKPTKKATNEEILSFTYFFYLHLIIEHIDGVKCSTFYICYTVQKSNQDD